ncbi:hypothetical protein HZC00_01200 [Candidatus Kaiserbacteria bacterium]|nr:hypothetical protein [Candidatus Kaiserbacteria bacterium]
MSLTNDLIDTVAYKNATTATEPDVLAKLANHDEHWVRVRVANNRHTPPAILQKLADDLHPTVRANTACRKDLPLDVILAIEARAQPLGDAGLIDTIQASLASRSDCPEAHLWRVFATQRFAVLIALVHNPNTPQSLGEALAQSQKRRRSDEAKEVKEMAMKKWPTNQPPG